ncbi:MAG: Protoheme farnesyltransferase [Bacilli bacterium]|nr:Protoheme farnesyltransferase [Bacilli bacterium]
MTVARLTFKKRSADESKAEAIYKTLTAYVELTKPRIMLLLLFTAFCAMMAAKATVHNLGVMIVTLIGLALSSGGAAALNMWYDRDIDALMHRTAGRPIPTGWVKPSHAFWFGVLLQLLSFVILIAWVNALTAWLTFGGFFYYVVIYTMWLKRRTPQNIVIGGGAGAFPPLIGWASVTGQLHLIAWVMFLIIFCWTPPHFWSLALYKNEDYVRAGVPMMPVVKGAPTTKWQSLVYTILLLFVSLFIFIGHPVNWLYLGTVLFMGLAFLAHGILLLFEQGADMTWAKRTFRFSLLYLPTVFILLALSCKQ